MDVQTLRLQIAACMYRILLTKYQYNKYFHWFVHKLVPIPSSSQGKVSGNEVGLYSVFFESTKHAANVQL